MQLHGAVVRKPPIEDVMTKEVKYCFEDEDVAEVLENLSSQQLLRLPVLDRDKRLTGILSLGDLATQTMDGAEPVQC